MTNPLPLLAVLLLATPSLALDGDCSSSAEYNGTNTDVSPAVDMGGGIVAQSTASYGGNGADFIDVHEQTRFEFCASGRAIGLWGNHLPKFDGVHSDVAAIVLDAIAAPESVALDEIVNRINASTSWGAGIIEAPATESCGCAVYYPGLRNARKIP